MANEDFNRIKGLLQVLADTFNRRLNGETLLFWAKALEPMAGWQALESAMGGTEFPTLRGLRDQAGGTEKPNGWKEIPRLTPEEKKRADHAAILSMLWLHYTRPKAWPLDAFDGSLIGRIMGDAFTGDVHAALARAMQIYDRATVLKWMGDQERYGK